MSESKRKVWKKQFDQRCPRVILHPHNERALEVAVATMNEETAALAPALVAALPEEERARVVRRVLWARNTDRVQDARDVAHRRALARAKREAGD